MAGDFYKGETACRACSIERARQWQIAHPDEARELARIGGQRYRARRMEDDPDAFRAELRDAARRLGRRYQAQTLPAAHRHGYQWTGPELETAGRWELTSREVAAMLGRTLYAVERQRHLLRTEPKQQNLAGLSRP